MDAWKTADDLLDCLEALRSIQQLAEDRPWPDPVVLGKIAEIAKQVLEN